MVEKVFESEWITYLWVFGMSIWGGMVSFFDSKEQFSWVRLAAHLTSSSFAGMMMFYLCQYMHVPEPLTGMACGVAAHMGTSALVKLLMKSKALKSVFESEDKEQ